MLLHRCALAGLLAVLGSIDAHANVYTVGPASTNGNCTHRTLQAAVDAAAAHAGPDEIRIYRNGDGYTAQAVVVNNQALTISGGFSSCEPLAPVGRTRLSGEGGTAAPVLTIRTSNGTPVDVQLRGLELVRGDQSVAGVSGGGLLVEAAGTVTLSDSRIAENQAPRGSGIAVVNTGFASMTLDIGDNVQVEKNGAAFREIGGGIFVYQATLRLGGIDTVVRNNVANIGGGIAVWSENVSLPALADIRSGGGPPDSVINGNVANATGGGLWVDGNSTVRLYTTDAGRPVGLVGNHAQLGGGIYAQGGGVRIQMWEGALIGNVADSRGGALYVGNGAYVGVGRYDESAPAGTVSCASTTPCALVIDNRAGSESVRLDGAVASLQNTDTELSSMVYLQSMLIAGNVGASLFHESGCTSNCSAGRIVLAVNSLIASNPESTALVSMGIGSTFACYLCTINGTGTGATTPLFETSGALDLGASILWEPGRDVIGSVLPSHLSAHELLVHDASDFSMSPGAIRAIRVGNPRFVALEAGDFNLAAGSPALDIARVYDVPEVDLAGNARVVDQPGVPDHDGPLDLGAFERALDTDAIFIDGFE